MRNATDMARSPSLSERVRRDVYTIFNDNNAQVGYVIWFVWLFFFYQQNYIYQEWPYVGMDGRNSIILLTLLYFLS